MVAVSFAHSNMILTYKVRKHLKEWAKNVQWVMFSKHNVQIVMFDALNIEIIGNVAQ